MNSEIQPSQSTSLFFFLKRILNTHHVSLWLTQGLKLWSPETPKLTLPHSPNACCCLVTQSCPTLCNPMDCSPPGSSVHEISQTRILEWVAIPFSTGSTQPRDWTRVSCIGRWILYHWATREALLKCLLSLKALWSFRIVSSTAWGSSGQF